MKRIRTIKIDGNLILGSTVIITVILDYVPSITDTIKISIEDPSDIVKVDNVAMTKVTDNVYRYFHQTAIADEDGVWLATIKATSGSSIIYEAKDFEMAENPLEY